MKETIANFFTIFERDIMTQFGYRIHEFSGTDEEKIDFLYSKIESDLKDMTLAPVPKGYIIELPNGEIITAISIEIFNTILLNQTDSHIYEAIFKKFNFNSTPLFISTPFVDGKIKIDKVIDSEIVPKAPFTNNVFQRIQKHYLEEFVTEEGFLLLELLQKDFFGAIELTYNQEYYVSSLKLLLSTIDSFAFLEFGDIKNTNIFNKWLTSFCDLSQLNIEENELWEYRNSLLHMTNSFSRKVNNKQVTRLICYVSKEDIPSLRENVDSKYFNIKTLIDEILKGTVKWAESFNKDKDKDKGKIPLFFERYDLVISDTRYGSLKIS